MLVRGNNTEIHFPKVNVVCTLYLYLCFYMNLSQVNVNMNKTLSSLTQLNNS